jgi:hypothetical protein
MPSKHKPDDEQESQAQDDRQENQQSTGEDRQSATAQTTEDLSQLVAALTQVIRGLRSQAASPTVDAAGRAASAFSDIQASLRPRLAPLPPQGVKADAISSTEVRLQWRDASGDADGFRLQRCQGRDCKDFADLESRVLAPDTSFQDRNLTGSSTYRYRVIAFNSAGESDASEVAAATTPKA